MKPRSEREATWKRAPSPGFFLRPRKGAGEDARIHAGSFFAVWLIVVVGSALAPARASDKLPDIPPASNAASYPLHETHKEEHVTIALDPYWEGKDSVFHLKFREHGILPVRLIVTNNNDQPITLKDWQVQFITARRQKAAPLTVDDLERRFAKEPSHSGSTRIPLPIPLPSKKSSRLPKGAAEEIDYLQFKAEAVEPHNTQSGFLFFDVSGLADLLAGSHILFTGLRNANGQELFYFDIPLQKAP